MSVAKNIAKGFRSVKDEYNYLTIFGKFGIAWAGYGVDENETKDSGYR